MRLRSLGMTEGQRIDRGWLLKSLLLVVTLVALVSVGGLGPMRLPSYCPYY